MVRIPHLPGRQRGDLSVADQVRRGRTDKFDGWWISKVLDSFQYLETDFGYRVDEVSLHFRGSHVRFAGDVFDLVIGYDPQDTGRMHAELWSRVDLASDVDHPRALALNDVLAVRDPSATLPDPLRGNLERSEVLSAISTWAGLFRAQAPDVLRGGWPQGVPITYLW